MCQGWPVLHVVKKESIQTSLTVQVYIYCTDVSIPYTNTHVHTYTGSYDALLMGSHTTHSQDWSICLSSVDMGKLWQDQKQVPSVSFFFFQILKCGLRGNGMLSENGMIHDLRYVWLILGSLRLCQQGVLLKTQRENTKRQRHYNIYIMRGKIQKNNWIREKKNHQPNELSLTR